MALGMAGIGTGFAFVNPASVNAAANALPQEEVGVGLGLFQGAFFLGGGTGPALIGTLLAARQESATDALNPLHTLDGVAFSDAFAAISLSLALSFVFALFLKARKKGA